MNAKKCDLCENFYDNYGKGETNANGISKVYLPLNNMVERSCAINTYDLCPDCMRVIEETITSLNTGEKGNNI